ncbi:hypothetical protein DB32_005471 [Sandaracinus amylolyticus]|uniref:Uncharacterized protein n=1 Tax=Sandaracinus amylolyticus TaxID=927083 RepID=A0A0F6YKN0_9BACT|nr:hypothetical protein DB32_005471 [Sandaracinus amylolyticus]
MTRVRAPPHPASIDSNPIAITVSRMLAAVPRLRIERQF